MVDFPTTLIIGLGGVGSEITADIYSKFIATHPSDIEKRNIFCLCFDTDAGDIKKRKEILPKREFLDFQNLGHGVETMAYYSLDLFSFMYSRGDIP